MRIDLVYEVTTRFITELANKGFGRCSNTNRRCCAESRNRTIDLVGGEALVEILFVFLAQKAVA